MKTLFFTLSIGLFVLWVSIFFGGHAGFSSHALIMLSVLFLLQGIITFTPKKFPKEAE